MDIFRISCRQYNHAGSFPDLEWATPFEKRILDTWSRLADPKIVSDEKRLIINWTEKTAKSETGIWFARPGRLWRAFGIINALLTCSEFRCHS